MYGKKYKKYLLKNGKKYIRGGASHDMITFNGEKKNLLTSTGLTWLLSDEGIRWITSMSEGTEWTKVYLKILINTIYTKYNDGDEYMEYLVKFLNGENGVNINNLRIFLNRVQIYDLLKDEYLCSLYIADFFKFFEGNIILGWMASNEKIVYENINDMFDKNAKLMLDFFNNDGIVNKLTENYFDAIDGKYKDLLEGTEYGQKLLNPKKKVNTESVFKKNERLNLPSVIYEAIMRTDKIEEIDEILNKNPHFMDSKEWKNIFETVKSNDVLKTNEFKEWFRTNENKNKLFLIDINDASIKYGKYDIFLLYLLHRIGENVTKSWINDSNNDAWFGVKFAGFFSPENEIHIEFTSESIVLNRLINSEKFLENAGGKFFLTDIGFDVLLNTYKTLKPQKTGVHKETAVHKILNDFDSVETYYKQSDYIIDYDEKISSLYIALETAEDVTERNRIVDEIEYIERMRVKNDSKKYIYDKIIKEYGLELFRKFKERFATSKNLVFDWQSVGGFEDLLNDEPLRNSNYGIKFLSENGGFTIDDALLNFANHNEKKYLYHMIKCNKTKTGKAMYFEMEKIFDMYSVDKYGSIKIFFVDESYNDTLHSEPNEPIDIAKECFRKILDFMFEKREINIFTKNKLLNTIKTNNTESNYFRGKGVQKIGYIYSFILHFALHHDESFADKYVTFNSYVASLLLPEEQQKGYLYYQPTEIQDKIMNNTRKIRLSSIIPRNYNIIDHLKDLYTETCEDMDGLIERLKQYSDKFEYDKEKIEFALYKNFNDLCRIDGMIYNDYNGDDVVDEKIVILYLIHMYEQIIKERIGLICKQINHYIYQNRSEDLFELVYKNILI